MNSLSNLYRLLEPLRIYALHKNSLIDSELAAYGAGFDIIAAMLEDARRGCFVQTAEGEALSLHEGAAGLPAREGAPEENRRELVLIRHLPPSSGDKAGLLEALQGAGLVSPQLEESPGKTGLLLSAGGIAPMLNGDTALRLAEQILPAHLMPETPGAKWDDIGALALKWDEWDVLGISWSEYALCGTGAV